MKEESSPAFSLCGWDTTYNIKTTCVKKKQSVSQQTN